MSQLSLFTLLMLLGAITQTLASMAPSLESRASKTCPRGQRVQLSIARGKNPTIYGRTLESRDSVVGAYIDFDTIDVTQAVGRILIANATEPKTK